LNAQSNLALKVIPPKLAFLIETIMGFTQKELNMRQRRWLKLIKDYDCEINYHPDKSNVVANTLIGKFDVQI
jgi:hypothetical protein